jgi:hypothetical protein
MADEQSEVRVGTRAIPLAFASAAPGGVARVPETTLGASPAPVRVGPAAR